MASLPVLFSRPFLQKAYQYALKTKDPLRRQQELSRALRWRRHLYPPGGTVMEIAKLDDGLRLWVNLCDKEEGNLYFGVKFEPDEINIVRKLVKPGDVFFDVGASIGVYSLIASQLVGSSGTVHGFEPASYAYEVLLKNVKLNGITNVVANQIAVSEQTGETEFFLNLDSGLASLGQTGRGQVVGTEKVLSISLDEYVKQPKISQINFLKVDVEGYEGHVLRGARHLIERQQELTILCELAEKNFKPLNLSVNEVIDWMRERGYEAWEMDREQRLLVKLETNRISDQDYDFVFVRPGTASHSTILEMSRLAPICYASESSEK
jgi:FkbM family methyltransferase